MPHLLVFNTCVASIFYCIVQCNNYIYLLFIKWDTRDISCRWRGYFAYMSIVAFTYSYLLQAVSRLFFCLLSTRYRWLISFKTHIVLILVKWIIALVAPVPAIITKDIYFRPDFLCWVPMESLLHVTYTLLTFSLLPIILVIAIYITLYVRIKRSGNNACIQQKSSRRQNRDLKVLRNIIILFSIYILGGVASVLYIFTKIELFYSMSIVFITLSVAIEKAAFILLDQEIRNTFKKLFCHSTSLSWLRYLARNGPFTLI